MSNLIRAAVFFGLLCPAGASSDIGAPVRDPAARSLPAFFMQNPTNPGSYRVHTPDLQADFQGGAIRLAFAGGNLTLRFPGAAANPPIEGLEPLGADVHVLTTRNPPRAVTAVPAFSAIRYRSLHPGIDMVYRASGYNLKSEFVVASGADPALIRVVYDGALRTSVAADGSLIVQTALGELREHAPELYQENGGGREIVTGSFHVFRDGSVGFEVGPYDRRRPLVIDPTISYSTYIGGSRFEAANAIAVDNAGNIYLAGWTESPDMPLRTPLQGALRGGVDLFVAKLDRVGSLVYCTYLGGSGEDRATGIAVGSDGTAYIAGWTQSWNFPTTAGSLQRSLRGGRDAFVVKLAPSGDRLLLSTYLGGFGYEAARAVAVDAAGNIYVAGDTTSTDFPAYRATQPLSGGQQDGFIAALTPTGAQLMLGTYFGGIGEDTVAAMVLDSAGNVYVTGGTTSPNFPLANPLQPHYGGGQDAFVARFGAGGTALVYSTYLGGKGGTPGFPESGSAIDVSAAGEVYIAGSTASPDFPLRNPLRTAHNGLGVDGFVVKINAEGNSLVYSTYLGGTGVDLVTTLRTNAAGNACVAGYTNSPTFPVTGSVQASHAGGYDGFVSCFTASGGSLSFSTLLGGAGDDSVWALAADGAGDIYIAGQTLSSNFPLVSALQNNNGGLFGGFVAKLAVAHPPTVDALTPSSGSGASQVFTLQVSDTAGYQDFLSVQLIINRDFSDYRGCHIGYDVPSRLLFLMNNLGTAFVGPMPLGSPGTLKNGQCVLDAGASSAVGVGNTLALELSLAFDPSFSGAKYVFTEAHDKSLADAGWQWRGTWTVPADHAPVVASLAPSSGSGASRLFTLQISDAAGHEDLLSVQLIINRDFSDYRGCHIGYDVPSRLLFLMNDAGTAFVGPLRLGSPGTLKNGQCVLDTGASSAVSAGNILTLELSLAFDPSFSGAKYVFTEAHDKSLADAGWQWRGTWTVPADHAPVVASLTPSSGSGASQVFTLQVSDAAGHQDLLSVQLIINRDFSDYRGCHIGYDVPSRLLFLMNDAGTAFVGPLPLGSPGTLKNGQCVLDTGGSAALGAGDTLTLELSLAFDPSFSGAKYVFTEAHDKSLTDAGWQWRGTWTVPADHAPAVAPLTLRTGNAPCCHARALRKPAVSGTQHSAPALP